ncbi:MAG: carbon monoxide dehydrogenase subunit G [Bacteroidia bacterium]|jgi:carbon monoxide dehydrogenase subunit G
MTEIKSDALIIRKSVSEVFNYLCDLRNHEALMPPDVLNFKASHDLASISLKGLGSFNIEKQNVVKNSNLILQPQGKLPFDFNIEWKLEDRGETTMVVGQVNAKLNMFIKMVAEPKLRSFVDCQVQQLKIQMEGDSKNA